MDFLASDDPVGYANYMIKSFGAVLENLTLNRLPKAVMRAKAAIPDDEIVGFLLCAIDRPPSMTGLIFCDQRHRFPSGLPAHTPPVVRRFYRAGYLVVEANTGGLFVVAHWYAENGALRPFYEVH